MQERPLKTPRSKSQILQPRSLIVSVHGQYYNVPSWDQTHVQTACEDEIIFCRKTVGGNGNDLDQESQHTSSSRVVSGFWDNSQWPESGLVLNYSLRKTLKNSAHVQYAPYPLEEVLATIGRLKSIQAFGRGSSHCPIWILQSPRCVRMRWSLGRTFSSTMEHLVRFRCVGWWWRVEEASVAWRCLT